MQLKTWVAPLALVAIVLATATGWVASQTLDKRAISKNTTFDTGPGTVGTEVYRQSTGQFFFATENEEFADDLHLTQAGNLVSFDFTYGGQLTSAVTSATAYVNFYSNDPTDSVSPPAGLLGSVVIPDVPIRFSTQFAQTETVDLATPIAVPQDIWMGVRIDLDGAGPLDGAFASAFFTADGSSPQLGVSHDVFYRGSVGAVESLNWRSMVTVRIGTAPPTNHPPLCFVSLEDAREDFLETATGVFVVTEGETITVPFIGVDQDDENLAVSSVGLPTGASLMPTMGLSPLTSTFEWTPTAADKSGAPYTIVVTFTDAAQDDVSCEVTVGDINLRPVCSASDQTVESTSLAGTLITLDGSATDPDDDDAGLLYHWDVSNGAVVLDDSEIAMPTGTFPIGVTMATLTVADGRGGVDVCDVLITVEDSLPPEVMCTSDIGSLWPPNHKMHTVNLIVTATDACSDPSAVLPITVFVRSNEPDNASGKGDGNTTGDVDGMDGFSMVPSGGVDVTSSFTYDSIAQQWVGAIRLRAERAGSGSGRKYTVDVSALDTSNNSAETSCCIVVAHDRRPSN